MRLCGACFPAAVKPIAPRWGVCDECGLTTECAEPFTPIRVPRSVPPASGWARLRRWVA